LKYSFEGYTKETFPKPNTWNKSPKDAPLSNQELRTEGDESGEDEEGALYRVAKNRKWGTLIKKTLFFSHFLTKVFFLW